MVRSTFTLLKREAIGVGVENPCREKRHQRVLECSEMKNFQAFCWTFVVLLLFGTTLLGCGQEEGRPNAIAFPDNQDEGIDQCDDGIRNGAETDIDCGGGQCPRCEQNSRCVNGSDCVTGICDRGVCADSQCRGRDCLAGQSCYRGDCFPECRNQEECPGDSQRCVGGACVPTNCEGVSCDEDREICYLGACYAACERSRDCRGQGAQCISGACIIPSCSDGIQTGDESDVDCGGSQCGPCEAGQRCLAPSDCAQDAGSWSSCEFSAGDICASQGVQSREVSTLECSNNICVGDVETETQSCTRDTDGISCGDVSPQSWGACQAVDGASACSTEGIQYRDVVAEQCLSGSCQAVSDRESRTCIFNPEGESCATGISCATDGVCEADGSCRVENIAFNTCAIDGQCFNAGEFHPEYTCKICEPGLYQDHWSYYYCTDTYTSTNCGSGAVSCQLPGYWEYRIWELQSNQNVPFENASGINLSTNSFQGCSSILDMVVQFIIGGFGAKGEVEVNLSTPWGGNYRVLERGEISGVQTFQVSYPYPVRPADGADFLGRSGNGTWTVNFNNTGSRFALENIIVEELIVELWCE